MEKNGPGTVYVTSTNWIIKYVKLFKYQITLNNRRKYLASIDLLCHNRCRFILISYDMI